MDIRKKIISRQLCIGSWIQTGDMVASEIMANAGYDWIAMDCEHTDIDAKEFACCARAMNGFACAPMARVKENKVMAIRSVLDAGAKGVIIPLVNSKEAAEEAVVAAKYPPIGIRGFAYCRANNWGADFDEYAAKANDKIAVIVMIESKESVDNIEEILSVKGVDGVFVGPYDMSGSYGMIGRTQHEIIKQACKKVSIACKKFNKAAGQHIVNPTKENVKFAIDEGFTFIALGMDTVFIQNGAKETMQMI